MSRETRWWWIRHAPVTSHAGRIYGQQDVPADLTGTEAAIRRLAAVLPGDAVALTSDLQRTIATAEALSTAGCRWAEHHREPDFREQHFGEWQGLTSEAFTAVRDRLPHSGWLAPAFERPPAGESFSDVTARVVPAIIRHTSAQAGRDIVAVGHGGSIRAALGFALGVDPESALSFSLETLSLTRLDHIETRDDSGVWRIVCVNRVFG
jgi:alpha-ribazole phosphatase